MVRGNIISLRSWCLVRWTVAFRQFTVVFIIFVQNCTLYHLNGFMPCTSRHWSCIWPTLDLPDIDIRVFYWTFLLKKKVTQSCHGWWTYRNKEPPVSECQMRPIKAFPLWMLAIFWIRSESKIKSLRTFNTRNRHTFPIAIPDMLLSNSLSTQQVCSKSTFKVFPRIPTLQLFWFTISLRSMWRYSERWSHYSM